jgi:uncharacterized protein (DUF2235 family)
VTALIDRLRSWWRGPVPIATTPAAAPPPGRVRGVVDHVIILDGTLSTLAPGLEGNCGLIYRLLTEGGPRSDRTVYYEPGLQWTGWRNLPALAQGRGLNLQIRRAYGWLASHYRPGDRIYLFGFSRGAFAVRSLAGVIDRIGLIRREEATERAIRQAYRHYRFAPDSDAARVFSHHYCHADAPVELVGVFDTVKALGLRLPLLWMLTDKHHSFHSAELGIGIRRGAQALALNETRAVFQPVLWDVPPDRLDVVEQVWFRGAHADIGGHLGSFQAARPLSNLPLVWMLGCAEASGLRLPHGWTARYPCDIRAPMVGTWRGAGAIFLLRRKRIVGRDPSERLHPSNETGPAGRPEPVDISKAAENV